MSNKAGAHNFLFTLFGFKRPRSTGYLLLLILIHLAGWCLFFFLPALLYPVRINDNRFIHRELLDKSILVVFFYVNYYWLIPRFFERKRYWVYGALTFGLFLAYLTCHVAIRSDFFQPFTAQNKVFRRPPSDSGAMISHFVTREGPREIVHDVMIVNDSAQHRPGRGTGFIMGFRNGMGFPPEDIGWFGIPKGIWAVSFNNSISSFILLLLMGGFIRLAFSFIRNQDEKRALENANLNAEVNFLKSQINPHFLFNTLNGIYSQAHARSEHTEHSILKLSDLLRYVLYDSGDDRVPLSKDIQYLSNYIDLQKIRLSKKISVDYVVEGRVEGQEIAPLLLITFVENAFKHGISYTRPSVIKIHVSIFEKTLTLLVSNPVNETNSFAGGGLGLKNVMRRLDLLYPGAYWLDVVHNDHLHIVNLKINLTRD